MGLDQRQNKGIKLFLRNVLKAHTSSVSVHRCSQKKFLNKYLNVQCK